MNDKARRERFEALWREHQGIVLKVASIYAHGAEDRRDLAQEIGIQLWRSLHRYDERRAKFSTWLYRIALNTAISQSRHKRHRTDAFCEPLQPFHLDTIGGDEADDERIAILYAAINDLDAFERALMLLYLEGRDHAEMAEVMGISQTNVATRINRIKHKLCSRVSAAIQPEHEHGT
ncbi:MAG TPA: sigma-70 family RNA polymerase sigma factor [Rhodanobacteraceae bacterium]|nr:sigma-70 family RNA polymerase sigma factor [Rhodanobacteraceae bacterium]